jgi:hypothetical protein
MELNSILEFVAQIWIKSNKTHTTGELKREILQVEDHEILTFLSLQIRSALSPVSFLSVAVS